MSGLDPTISIGSPPLRIFAARSDDRVTGRVEFPYEVSDRTEIPIDYRSQHPPIPNRARKEAANPQSPIPPP